MSDKLVRGYLIDSDKYTDAMTLETGVKWIAYTRTMNPGIAVSLVDSDGYIIPSSVICAVYRAVIGA